MGLSGRRGIYGLKQSFALRGSLGRRDSINGHVLPFTTFQSYREVLEMESNDHLLSVGEVASWLGMSTPWIYKQCEKGTLPFLRLGQAIRFDPEDIKRYLASRKNLNITKPDGSRN